LKDTLASIASQINPGDEIIVICNGVGDDGNWAREQGAERARGSHLLFCDDDDVFLPGAFEVIRKFAWENPGRIGLFRRRFNAAVQLQWQEPRLSFGGLQSMSFCIPNVPGKVGHWIPVTPDWSDIYVIQEAAREQGAEPIFCDAVIGLARPERNVFRRVRYALRLRTRLRRLLGETYVPRD
jgi:glycosyltransferase involved in cell wall biosynthesis